MASNETKKNSNDMTIILDDLTDTISQKDCEMTKKMRKKLKRKRKKERRKSRNLEVLQEVQQMLNVKNKMLIGDIDEIGSEFNSNVIDNNTYNEDEDELLYRQNKLNDDYNELKRQFLEITISNKRLDYEIKENEKRLLQMTTTMSNKEDILTTMTRKLTNTENENLELKVKNKKLEEIKKTLRDLLDGMNKEMDIKTENETELNHELKSREDTNQRLGNEIKDLEFRLNNVKENKEKMRRLFLDKIRENKENEIELNSKIKEFEEEEAKLKEEKERLVREGETNDNKINELKVELDEKNKEMERIQIKNEKAQKIFEYLNNRLKEKEENEEMMLAIEKEKANIQSQMTLNMEKIMEENGKLQKQIEQIRGEKNQLNQNNCELQKQVGEMRNNRTDNNRELEEIKLKNCKLIQEKGKYNERIYQLFSEIKQLKEGTDQPNTQICVKNVKSPNDPKIVLVQYNNEIYEIRVLPSSRVNDLKQEVLRRLGEINFDLKFLYNWKILDEYKSLADCGIEDDDAVLCLKKE